MAGKYNGTDAHMDTGSGDMGFDLNFDDMPGQYVDDILHSELPGSHLDELLYGELPGSHLDIVLKSPLPGGSTDEILSSPLHGIAADSVTPKVGHSHERSERFHDLHERSESFSAVKEPASTGLKDLVHQAFPPGNGAVSASTPNTRARNSSKYVRKQMRKERPRKKRGAFGVFLTMIILISVLSRVIVPVAERLLDRGKPKGTDEVSLLLTDSEIDVFTNVWNGLCRMDDSYNDFRLSDQELLEKYQSHGYEMFAESEEKQVFGGYDGGETSVRIFRNDDYLSYSCQTDSGEIDLAAVEEGTVGVMPYYISEILGRDIIEIGIRPETLSKFYDAAGGSKDVTYQTEDFVIYFYDYEDYSEFYLYGDNGKAYLSFEKDGRWISMAALFQ